MRCPVLLAEHMLLWRRVLVAVWERRGPVVGATVLFWVPWRLLIPELDQATGFSEKTGFPLDLLSDAVMEPLFAGVVLSLLSDRSAGLGRAVIRGFVLFPRLFLVDIKIAAIGLAVPVLVLYLGTATVLTLWDAQPAGRLVIALTCAGLLWTIYVMFRYMLAHVVLVGEWRRAGWEPSGVVSTGWSLWAGRSLLAGRRKQALLVVVAGQLAVGLVLALSPAGNGVLARTVSGLLASVSVVWWSLLLQLLTLCLTEHSSRADRMS